MLEIADTSNLLVEGAYALGIGLMVGIERQHHIDQVHLDEGEERDRPLGVRTFALLAVLGWLSALLGDHWSWLPAVALVAVTGLVIGQYVTRSATSAGLTTEIAAIIVFCLGMLVRIDRSITVTAALAVTALLVSKSWLHAWVDKLRRVDLTSTLQLLIAWAVLLPLLPKEPVDPWDALPLHKIGWLVILLAGIDYVGYVSRRLFGARRGAGITGLLGGLTSSTAVTVSMARTGRDEAMRIPAQLSVFLANFVLFPRVIVVAAVISPAVATQLLIPMGAMALSMLAGAWWKWRASGEAAGDSEADEAELKNPLALWPAVRWAVILSAVFVLSKLAHDYLGQAGLYVAAGAAGLADVDAITLAVAGQVSEGALLAHVAGLAVAIAVISNTIVKGGIALFAGGRRFGADIVKLFAVSVVVGIAAALLLLL